MLRQVRLMTGGAELGSPVKALHDGTGMAVRVLQYLVVWNFSRYALAVFIYHHRRDAHDIAAVAGSGLQALNRVTDHAGEAVVIEFSVDLRILSEGTTDHADWVVATIAVPGEFDPFSFVEKIYAGAVKRLAGGGRGG